MTTARSMQVDLESTPYYHCMVRCVRRSFLCGVDEYTGKNYDHRKQWIVARIKQLSSIFSINVCAYAVMSNHYHVTLHVDEGETKKWSDEEVFDRWKAIFPLDASHYEDLEPTHEEKKAKIDEWRERLSSLSWFMRCLNEPIARSSNKEDECTGRFWEGRFKCQALLDVGALLSAMVYVDLNPIRAGLATTPEGSDFTSIQERIRFMANQLKSKKDKVDVNNLKQPTSLTPLSAKPANKDESTATEPRIDFSLSDYIHLVETTGKVIRDDKPGAIPEDLAPLLDRLGLRLDNWVTLIKGFESQFRAAAGAYIYLLNFSARRGAGVKGAKSSMMYYNAT